MMYIAPVDGKYLCSDENYKMQEEYEKRFGERFIPFNYPDFPGDENTLPGQAYKNAIIHALEEGKPYHIVSKRYNVIDH